jgi:hypothetical protein
VIVVPVTQFEDVSCTAWARVHNGTGWQFSLP